MSFSLKYKNYSYYQLEFEKKLITPDFLPFFLSMFLLIFKSKRTGKEKKERNINWFPLAHTAWYV